MERTQDFKDKSKIAYNTRASNYDSSSQYHHAHRLYGSIIEAMDRFEFNSVLDIGCGTGNVLFELLKRKKIALAGIDISEKMLNIAKERLGDEVDLMNGDSEHLPWKNHTFDMVICTDSFHHYPDPKAVLGEMRRVLNPGGKLIIADPWAPSPIRQIINLIMPLGKGGDVRIYSIPEMKDLMEKCGFTLISQERKGISAFVMVATPA